MTRSDAGTVSVAMASRFVQCGISANIGGTQARAPEATTSALLGDDPFAVDFDGRSAGQPGATPDEMSTLADEAVNSHLVIPRIRRLLADSPRHRGPVGRDDRRSGSARDAPAFGQQIGRPHHHLGGDAAPIGALPADELRFNADDVETGLGELSCYLFSSGPQSDDDCVAVHRVTDCPSW